MKVAIYTRLSKDRGGLSENTAIQEREAREYADAQNWPLVGIFTDSDISASRYTTKPRPGYDTLIAAIERGQVEVVLCTEMTRLYRRLEELLQLIRLAERSNLKRIETTDGFGYYLHTGEGVHAAVASVNNAVLESRKISDRVKRKHRARAEAGLTNGGSRRYGYERDGMTVRALEAAVIRECVERSINGEVTWRIALDLNERGVPTAYGHQWRTENLQRLILSKRVIGVREHNGAEYPAKWPAIIPPAEQERVRLAWKLRKQGPNARARGARTYLLTGIVFCHQCGAPMRGNGRSLSAGYQRRYRCTYKDATGRQVGCGRTFRSAEPLEQWVTEAVWHRFGSPEVMSALGDHDDDGEITRLINEIAFCRSKLDDYVDDYASGLLNREQLARAKARTQAQLTRHQDELTGLRSATTLPRQPLPEVWDDLGLDTQLDIIRLLVDRVLVHPGHPGSTTWRSWRFDPEKVEIVWRTSPK